MHNYTLAGGTAPRGLSVRIMALRAHAVCPGTLDCAMMANRGHMEMATAPQEDLSARELEILRLVATGVTNQQIACTLHISPNTVKTHLRNIFAKLHVESRTEATLYAVQHGLITVPSGAVDAEPISEPPPVPVESAVLRAFHDGRASLAFSWQQGLPLAMGLILALSVLLWPAARAAGRTTEPTNRLFDDSPASGSAFAQAPTTRWRERTAMVGALGRFALAQVKDRVYVIGGAAAEGVSALVQYYQPDADQWMTASSKPTAASNIGAAVIDGLVYVPGGLSADGQVLDVLEVYDPAADRWSTGPSLPTGLCAYAIVADNGGLYLFGGWNGDTYVDSVYYFDVARSTWQQVARLTAARGFAAAAWHSDRIYLVGGYDGETEYRTCESFDVAAATRGENPWEGHADMQAGRAGHAMVPVLGHLYVFGGGWQESIQNAERYDVTNGVWGAIESPILGDWRTLGAAAVDSTEGLFIYTFGGWHGNYLAGVHAYQAFYRLYLP
jgi:DNA-binding CsgD family transcriptional regulator